MALKIFNPKILIIAIVVAIFIAFFFSWNQFSVFEKMKTYKPGVPEYAELSSQYSGSETIVNFMAWGGAILLAMLLYKFGSPVFVLIAGLLLLILSGLYPSTLGHILYKSEQLKAMWLFNFLLLKLASPIGLVLIFTAIIKFIKKLRKAESPENISAVDSVDGNIPHDQNREGLVSRIEDYACFNSAVFNITFTIFSISSFILFLFGTGGWIGMIEFALFVLASVILVILGIIRLFVNLFRKKKNVIAKRKTVVIFIIIIAVILSYITIFNMGDCGDADGYYNILKKIVMGNNACQESSLDITKIGSILLPLAIPAYLIILLIFSWFINSRPKATEENLSFLSSRVTNIFSAVVVIFSFVIISLFYFTNEQSMAPRKFSQSASKDNDITICDKINPSGDWEKIEKGTCYMLVISKIYRDGGGENYLPSNCNKVTDSDYKADCITFASGLLLNNISLCDSLKHVEIIERCKISIARFPDLPFER